MPELADLTAQCIRCGFCLESCPTFQISGDETESPRGRIYLVRSLEEGSLVWSSQAAKSLDTCVGCLACETACPSGVQYRRILGLARSKYGRRWQVRLLLDVMTRPALLTLALAIAKALNMDRVPRVLSKVLSAETQASALPPVPDPPVWPDLEVTALPPVVGEVCVLEGCVTPALFPEVNMATERLLRRVGFTTKWLPGCCGALHAHNGFAKEGATKLSQTLRDSPPMALTNTAGCGSHARDHGGSSTTVEDATTFLVRQGLEEKLASSQGLGSARVAYHEACHLTHGLGEWKAPQRLLHSVPGLELTDLDPGGACCGSGGVYNFLQPDRARKLQHAKACKVAACCPDIVVSGNPGCNAWLAQGLANQGRRVQVLHTLVLLESSFSGWPT